MARPRKIPSYCKHKSGQAYARFGERNVYFGVHGTPEAEENYHRTIAEWLASKQNGGTPRAAENTKPPSTTSVSELLIAFYEHELARWTGRHTGEKNLSRLRCALAPVRKLYGTTPIADFTPDRLVKVRDVFIRGTHSRAYIRDLMGLIRQCFRWGTERTIVPPHIWQGITAVANLRADDERVDPGRFVEAADRSTVRMIRRKLPRQIRAVIDLMILCGMRPNEALQLRMANVDTSRKPWLYTVPQHKTAHKGKVRKVLIGPRGQRIIRQFLPRDPSMPLFSPREAVAEWRLRLTSSGAGARKRKAEPRRAPGDQYEPLAMYRAMKRACEAAKLQRVTPYQIRHLAATLATRRWGREKAARLLGHSGLRMMERYDHSGPELIRDVIQKHG